MSERIEMTPWRRACRDARKNPWRSTAHQLAAWMVPLAVILAPGAAVGAQEPTPHTDIQMAEGAFPLGVLADFARSPLLASLWEAAEFLGTLSFWSVALVILLGLRKPASYLVMVGGGGRPVAIKQGWSVPGLLFGNLWYFSRIVSMSGASGETKEFRYGAPGSTLLVLCCLSLIPSALTILGFDRVGVDTITRVVWAAQACLAAFFLLGGCVVRRIGMGDLPFRSNPYLQGAGIVLGLSVGLPMIGLFGNTWLRQMLESNGFEVVGEAVARNPGQAVAAFEEEQGVPMPA